MATSTRPVRSVRQSPSASTVAASTLVHTVGRFDTRPSFASAVSHLTPSAATVMVRRSPRVWRDFPVWSPDVNCAAVALDRSRMRPTLVILVVGLSPRHLGPQTPRLAALARAGAARPLAPVFPALTCSVQATFMTGAPPRDHGIVGNGWLFRDLMEVWFWRQSNALVAGEKIWEAGKRRDPAFTCANLFWWYNMAARHDIGVTPRPIYKADGRKLPDCYTKPAELRDELTRALGTFPLFQFWGPATSIASSRGIADATLHVRRPRAPPLTLAYLPPLDYDLQRFGPDDPRIAASLCEIDAVAGDLIADAGRDGACVIVLSEYGIG